jgi:hypothetical protein
MTVLPQTVTLSGSTSPPKDPPGAPASPKDLPLQNGFRPGGSCLHYTCVGLQGMHWSSLVMAPGRYLPPSACLPAAHLAASHWLKSSGVLGPTLGDNQLPLAVNIHFLSHS